MNLWYWNKERMFYFSGDLRVSLRFFADFLRVRAQVC